VLENSSVASSTKQQKTAISYMIKKIFRCGFSVVSELCLYLVVKVS